jgi:hypothetical protein
MKRLLIIGFLTIMAVQGFSQIEKKTLLLGGYANFYTTDNHSVLSVNPHTGFFLSDRFCLGISLPILYTSGDLYWGLSPFGRYYFKPKESRSLFILGAVGITSFINSEHTLTDRALTLGVGHVWLLNKSVGFETILAGGTDFDTPVEIGVNLGFQIYFNKSGE